MDTVYYVFRSHLQGTQVEVCTRVLAHARARVCNSKSMYIYIEMMRIVYLQQLQSMVRIHCQITSNFNFHNLS